MFKRIGVASLIVITVFLAVYTAIWVYTSHVLKRKVERVALDISRHVSKEGGEFYYSYSRIGGYPFRFDINFHDMRFSHEDSVVHKMTTEDKVTLSIPVFGNSINVLLPHRLEALLQVDHALDHLQIFYQERPVISLQGTERIFSPLIMKDLYNHLLRVVTHVNVLNYMDQGMMINRIDDSVNIMASQSNFIGVVLHPSLDAEEQETEFFWESRGINLDPLVGRNQPLGNIDISTDFAFKGPLGFGDDLQNSMLNIRQMRISNEQNRIHVSGLLETEEEDALPFGDLRLEATQYTQLIDKMTKAYNQLMVELQREDLHVTAMQTRAFKRFIRRIADVRLISSEDLRLEISREKGQSLYVGKYDLPQILEFYERSFN